MDIPNSDTVHTFTLDNLSFGDLSKEEVYECMKDGRLASHFLERQLTKWFPALTRVDQKGHDHVDTDGILYDQKCFTRRGLGFAPSHMGGKGRVFVQEEAHKHAKDLIYIACDINEMPVVRVRFLKGSELIKQYPKCKIPAKDRAEIFQLDA
jgi:hypothetical protein